MSRLPIPGNDSGTWGTVLNDFLSQSLTTGGELKTGVVSSASLSSAIELRLAKADSAYQKAGTGIPASDLTGGVQASLGRADAALQAELSSKYAMRALTYRLTQQQTGAAQVKWLTFGSSVADMKIRNIGNPYLLNAYGGNTTGSIIGSYGDPPTGAAAGVPKITVNSSTGTTTDRTTDFDVWPSGITTGFQAAGSRVYGVSGSATTCNHIELYYVTGPANSLDGGTFSYAVDAGGATNISTLAVSAGIEKVSLTPTLGAHTITVTWVSGNIRLIGAAFWRTDVSGITWMSCAQGGINLFDVADQAFANFQKWIEWTQPDVITFEMKANQISTAPTIPNLNHFQKWLNSIKNSSTANAGPDVVVIGAPPDIDAQPELIVHDTIRSSVIPVYAPGLNVMGWDGYRPLASYQSMVAFGWHGDGIHSGWQAEQFLAFLMARDLNLFNLPFAAKSGPISASTLRAVSLMFGSKTALPNGTATIKADASGTDLEIDLNRWFRLWTADGTTTEAMRIDPSGTINSWVPRTTSFGGGNAAVYGSDVAALEIRHGTTPNVWANLKARGFVRLTTATAHSSAGGALAIDFTQRGNQKITLNANTGAVSFANEATGVRIGVVFIQGAGGPYTIGSWPGTIKFAGGAAPTLSTTIGARDSFEFEYDAGVYYEVNRSMDVR